MTLSPPPADPAEAYGLMGPLALLSHQEAIVEAMRTMGVEITPEAQVGLDALAESVAEHVGRTDPRALESYLARLTGGAQRGPRLAHTAGRA